MVRCSFLYLTVDSFVETALWQTFASVLIPGFCINRIVKFSSYILQSASAAPTSRISPTVAKWAPTAIGLASIFVIFQPIDNLVHYGMDTFYKPAARSIVGTCHIESARYLFSFLSSNYCTSSLANRRGSRDCGRF